MSLKKSAYINKKSAKMVQKPSLKVAIILFLSFYKYGWILFRKSNGYLGNIRFASQVPRPLEVEGSA